MLKKCFKVFCSLLAFSKGTRNVGDFQNSPHLSKTDNQQFKDMLDFENRTYQCLQRKKRWSNQTISSPH